MSATVTPQRPSLRDYVALASRHAMDYGVPDADVRTGAIAYEHCERCRYEFYERQRKQIARTGAPIVTEMKHTYRKNSMVMKPKGQPCLRCGDNSPVGTYPWNGPTCSRYVFEAEQPSQVQHGAGCQCRRVAQEAAA